jgi:hypothetical protein
MNSLKDLVRIPERQYDNIGFVYLDWVTTDDDGQNPLRALVVESAASLTAYVGVPLDHLLAHLNYEEMDGMLDVHGGMTYGTPGGTDIWPAGWYWYGWDYAHWGDYTKIDRTYGRGQGGHEWTIPEVYAHAQAALRQLRNLTQNREENS